MNKRKSSEHFFRSFDHTELFYRVWAPTSNGDKKKALIVLHRGHEHSGRLQGLVDELSLSDYTIFAFDMRGHGKSPGPRGYAPDFSCHVADLDTFARLMSKEHDIPIQDMGIVANSVGAVIAATWVHDYAPQIRCMALAAPAFDIKLYVPLAKQGLNLLNGLKKPAFISSYVKAKFLTHDPEQVKLYENDPLITRDISVNILLGLYQASERIIKDAQAITTPTLVLSAGSDWVVHEKAQREFFDKLGSKVKEFESYPGFYHGILYEEHRHLPLQKIQHFILEQFKKPFAQEDYRNAHFRGYTYEEYKKILGSPGKLKELSFFTQRQAMSAIGKLSRGIQIGLETGFDSGLSLEHIYKNQPQGVGLVGKGLDYFYINQLGWRGIRQRKLHLQQLLEDAIDELIAAKKPVRILDVAAGGGRYVLETLEKYPHLEAQVLIRDNVQKNLDEAKRLCRKLKLENVKFEIADAFDPASFERLSFKPNIVIASGLYELFPNNERILQSMKGIASCMEEGGKLIYTGQPWHPQLELIAHTLRNRDQKRWVMRRRTQAELDYLTRESGFDKLSTKIDHWGIFTVSVGQVQKQTEQVQ